jgi:hypothetical protein
VSHTLSYFFRCSNLSATVLHPYFKLEYIKHKWGGPAEKAAEEAAGNPNAKDWQDEALKVLERTVRLIKCFKGILTN